MAIKKKMRIQLLNEDLVIQSDRLVDQQIEFYQGPKETHEGPIKLEVILESQKDIENIKLYLDKLSGNLPLDSKPNRSATPSKISKVKDKVEDFLKLIKETDHGNQDKFIKTLRDSGFVFVTYEHLKKIIPDLKLKDKKHAEYEYMINCTRLAKDPRNDKFDPRLLFGIKILEKRSARILVYMYNKFNGKMRLEVPKEQAIGFKETNLIKYPQFMVEEEREKWGIEHRLLMNNPDKKPSKFYNRWKGYVTLSDEQKLKGNGKKKD